MMTEAEAKKRWCPFARSLDWASDVIRQGDEPVMVHAAVNRRNSDGEAMGTCIGSACMAWRVRHGECQREDHSGARDVLNTEALRTGRHVRREGPPGSLGILIIDATGYCGLAGAPAP